LLQGKDAGLYLRPPVGSGAELHTDGLNLDDQRQIHVQH
jgi:hypothetical protein